ncbi:MAG: hypothetical protein PHP64_05145 [Actinomycetota bacterium]|nr:hypothetical protein [Actinomycetota bacterium]
MNQNVQGRGEPEKIRDEAVSPVGDFIALVGGFAGLLFAAFMNWYATSEAAKETAKVGIKTPVGVLCFMISAGVFAFAIVMLIGRFVNPQFRLMRSPGWVYGTAAAILYMACIFGLVVTPEIQGIFGKNYGLSAGIIMELIAASAIGVGGLLKF